MDTDLTDFRQLVDHIHPEALHHQHHQSTTATSNGSSHRFEMAIDSRGGSASSSPRSILFPNAAPPGLPPRASSRVNPPLGGPLGGVLTGQVSVTTRTSPVVMVANGGLLSSTTSSSPEIFGDDAASLYSGRGGGSDGGGEAAFSVNDFVETFMDAQEEEGGSSGTEYPDEVYTDSEDDDYDEGDGRRKFLYKVSQVVNLAGRAAAH